MAREYRSRTFKSGNSVALRLPAGLEIPQGVEMTVREEAGHFVFEPVKPPAERIDLTGIYGSCPGLKPVERLECEPRKLDREGRLLR